MRLVKLHHQNGECVYVNPAHVAAVEPYAIYATPEGKTRVERVGVGSRLFFALIGSHCTDAGKTEYEPYWMAVTECPKDVAGLFLDPLR